MEEKTTSESKIEEPEKLAQSDEQNGEVVLQVDTPTSEEPTKGEEGEEKSKPLLEDESVKIIINSEKEGEDTPTLPLPTKKNRKEQKDSSDKKKLSSKLIHPVNQIKEDWDTSSNILEFLFRTVCVITMTLGWFFCIGGIPFMAIIMLIVGSVYVHDCSAQPLIPVYLIVSGVLGTIQHFTSAFTKYRNKNKQDTTLKRAITLFDGLLQLFLTIWFICGCVWVYGIYEPEYIDPNKTDIYCKRGLYLFAFWLFNFSFIVLTLILVAVLITLIYFVAAKSE